MRFKEDVILFRKDNQTIIKKGIYEYEIEDENELIYKSFSKNSFHKNTTSKEQFNFLKENNLICEEYNNELINSREERNIYFFESFFNEISPLSIHEKIKKNQ